MAIDPIQMLLDDHQKVRTLHQQYQQARDDRQKLEVAREILAELDAHSKIEEELFYPTVERKGTAKLKQIVFHGEGEHATIDAMVVELKSMDSFSPEFDTLFTELMRDVEHHVQEEEGEMLPQARGVLGDEADQLGRQMQRLKQQALGIPR